MFYHAAPRTSVKVAWPAGFSRFKATLEKHTYSGHTKDQHKKFASHIGNYVISNQFRNGADRNEQFTQFQIEMDFHKHFKRGMDLLRVHWILYCKLFECYKLCLWFSVPMDVFYEIAQKI